MEEIIVAIGDIVFKREANEALRYAGFIYVTVLILVALFVVKRPVNDANVIANSGKAVANFFIVLVVLALIALLIVSNLKWN